MIKITTHLTSSAPSVQFHADRSTLTIKFRRNASDKTESHSSGVVEWDGDFNEETELTPPDGPSDAQALLFALARMMGYTLTKAH